MVNRQTGGCGGVQLIPENGLGRAYRVFTKKAESGSAPQVGIMSTNDNTKVTIRLPPGKSVSFIYSSATYSSAGTNEMTIDLAKFETFVIQSTVAGSSLIGTYISSNERLAIFAGGKLQAINPGQTQQGHFVEQMIPIGRQGKTFVVPRVPDQLTNLFYSAVITRPGTLLSSLPAATLSSESYRSAGEVVEWSSTSPQVIISTHDFGITQFSSSSTTTAGSPTAWNLIPVENWSNVYRFHVPTLKAAGSADVVNYYVLLTMHAYHINNVYLNSKRVAVQGAVGISESDYLTGWIEVTAGTHSLQLYDGVSSFGAYMYVRNQAGPCTIGATLPACLIARDAEASANFMYKYLYIDSSISQTVKVSLPNASRVSYLSLSIHFS